VNIKKRTKLIQSKFTKKYTLVFLIIALAFILSFSLGTVSAADWSVGPGGTHNYTSIQDAINNNFTLSGDTISVYDNGTPYTYNENVVVNKTNLTVRSAGRVTVSGSSNPANPVFTINNQGTYAYITGFILSGATNSAGVLVTGTNDVTLNNLTINNCQHGVLMTGTSTNISLENLNISSTQGHGIYFNGDLTNITVKGAQINNTGNNAIDKYDYSNLNGLSVVNSTITNPSGRGIFLTTFSDAHLKNILINNVNITGATSDGIYISMGNTNCGNVTITNTTINNSSMHGMSLYTRGLLYLENNTFSHNGYAGGDNQYYGLYVNGVYNTEVNIANDNELVENRNGIRLDNVGKEANQLIFTGTQLINNAGFPVWINNGHYITITNVDFDDAVTQIATGARIIQAIRIEGISSNISLENLNISSTQGHGIYFYGDLTNIVINGAQINNTGNNAIDKYDYSNLNGLSVVNSTITNPSGRGIFLTTFSDAHLKNILINNVNITGATSDGIYISMGNTNCGNVTITNTTINNSSMHGMSLYTRGLLYLENNTFSHNGYAGGDNQYYGLYVNGVYNTEVNIANDNELVENRNGIRLDNVGKEANQLIFTGTQLINNAGFPVWINNGHYITITDANFDDTATQAATGVRILQAIHIDGISSNITLENLNISSTQHQGIYLSGDLTNITVNGAQINNTGNNAIEKYGYSNLNGLSVVNSTITNPNGRGIFLTTESNLYLKNILIDNVSITGATSEGIYIYMGNTDSGNVTITNTTINNNAGNGLFATTRGTVTINNNSFSNNGGWGIQLIGNNNPTVTLNNNNISHNGNGLRLQSISGGNFQDNQLINNTGDDLYATDDTNNTFTRLTLGVAHPTTVTFDYINGIIMNGVESPPADPSGLFNIGKYVDMQGWGSTTVNLKVHYNDSDVVYLNEASLKNFHFNTNWSELPQPNGVNTTERYVYANGISSFSTFAPLGEKPPTMLTVTDVSGLNGQTVSLEATLSIQGTPIAGKPVHFTVNGISLGSNVTDDNGIATLNYLITLIPGTYTINATFNGDGDYYATDATSTLTVYKNSTSIVVNDVTGVNSQNVQLKAILKNQDGTPITGKTIDFTVNGTSVGSAVTDGTGQAILSWMIPSSWALGNKIIQAEFLGTDSYNTSQNTATLTVDLKPTAKASIKGGLFNVNKNVYLSMNKPGTIYYTRNGSTPTKASTKYTGYLTISSTTTLRFIGVDLGGNVSPVYTEKYVIDKTAPKVTYTYPKNLSTGQSRTATLYLKFSETLKVSTYWSKIFVKDLKTGKKVSITKWIKGNLLYIKTNYKRASLRIYQVYVPYKAVKDFAGNNLVKTFAYKFKTRR
jgi:hypothetical protein